MKKFVISMLAISIILATSFNVKACTVPIPAANGNPVIGGIAVGTMTAIMVGNTIKAIVTNEAPKLRYGDVYWNDMVLFQSEKIWSTQEASTLADLLDNDTLLSKNLLASQWSLEREGNFYQVNNKRKTLNDSKGMIVLPGGEIKNNSLQLYYLKLPQNLINSKKDIKIEATFMYQIPERFVNTNDNNNFFDIMIYPRKKYSKIASNISKNKLKKEIEEAKKPSNFVPVNYYFENNIKFAKKDFVIKKKFLQKHKDEFVFVVCQHGLTLRDDNLNHIKTYNAVLRIK